MNRSQRSSNFTQATCSSKEEDLSSNRACSQLGSNCNLTKLQTNRGPAGMFDMRALLLGVPYASGQQGAWRGQRALRSLFRCAAHASRFARCSSNRCCCCCCCCCAGVIATPMPDQGVGGLLRHVWEWGENPSLNSHSPT